MSRSSRRAFVFSAGCAAAVSMLDVRRNANADNTLLEAAPELQPLIERERTNILATMARENIPGAAVCLIYDGRPAWIEGFGTTDPQSKRPVGVDTIFSIQSTSKNLATTAIMLAVQRGLLDLDKPITTYLPGFSVHSRFEAKPERKMTLRHLLSNRAGFTHEAPVGNNFEPSFPDFETHVRSISATWLRYPVNVRYSYSNLGFDLAGYILQTVSKLPFAECLRTLLLDPLGMKDTTAATHEYAQRANRAAGHVTGFDTVPLEIPLIPSGGVYASARDMATYLLFHLNKGKAAGRAFLEEKLWNEMHSFSFPGAYSLGVGGGVFRFGETDIRMLTHNGGGFGFGCVCRFYPQARLGWAFLFNRYVDAAYQIGGPLLEEILVRQYGERKARIRVEDLPKVDLPQRELKKFIGHWVGRGFSLNIEPKNGTLVIQRDGADVPLRVTSPTHLAIPGKRPFDDAVTMRYAPPRKGATAYLESERGDGHLDYNDGPDDAPGADRKEWDAYIGEYAIYQWGKLVDQVRILRKNGYLYLGEVRLVTELEPGLFFTSDGEAVDFRQGTPTWRNIRLQSVIQ